MAWAMGVMFALSVTVWYFTLEKTPARLKLSTGKKGGLYYQVGEALEEIWLEETGKQLEIIASSGTIANHKSLIKNETDFAILQGGAVSLEGLSIIAPLYPELVHVIVRKESDIRSIGDLKERQIIIGASHSGMQDSAMKILQYHGIEEDEFQARKSYFMEMKDDPSIEAAIVTAGMMNPDLKDLLNTGNFRLIPIDYAEAIAMQSPFFIQMVIPKALYGFGTVSTDVDCVTVATTSLLVAREDIHPVIVDHILQCLFEHNLWMKLPTLHSTEGIRDWSRLRLHPRARQYFHPSDRVGYMANIMETLAAFKELAFALFAGLYLLWDQWRRIKEKDAERRMLFEKNKLDALLTKTVTIERSQMESNNIVELRAMLDKVTRIKLKALDELTHESLRGDRIFLIFLTQCANLINKIQAKITQLNIEDSGLETSEKINPDRPRKSPRRNRSNKPVRPNPPQKKPREKERERSGEP
jgi:TRAP transporter TAXI family solute receptor